MDYIDHQPMVSVETTLESFVTGRVMIFVIGFVITTIVLLFGVKPWKENNWKEFYKYYVVIMLGLMIYAFVPVVIQTIRHTLGKPVLEDVPYEEYEDMEQERIEYELWLEEEKNRYKSHK